MPVKCFEPRSSIQRIVDMWSGAPLYLTKAARTTDPVARMQHVITFSLCSVFMVVGQNKPFNPLLGETHQGSFSDGTKFFCEHTSHHPPITNFLLENDEWTMSGYYEAFVSMGMNYLISGIKGPNHVDFKDGTRISFNQPELRIGGTVSGERNVIMVNSTVFEDVKNGIKALISFNTYKKPTYFSKQSHGSQDGITGLIYQANVKGLKATPFGPR